MPLEFCVISLEKETLRARNHTVQREMGRSDVTKEGTYQKIPVKILKWTDTSQSVLLVGAGHYLADLQF